jgi:hypothetical protein
MRLPENVRKRFQAYGREGGRQRARQLSSASRKDIARKAAMIRWISQKFGTAHFEDLGIPGGEMIDHGLRDLLIEHSSKEAYLVALAAPRLRREGVPVPIPSEAWIKNFPDLHEKLYRLLEEENEELAHARYNAYLRQVVSFADALAQTAPKPHEKTIR